MRSGDDIQPVPLAANILKSWLEELAPSQGLELVGAVSLPCDLPHRKRFFQYLSDGRHGGLEYLSRDPAGRVDPNRKNPWARSILVMVHRYTAGWREQDPAPASGGPAAGEVPWLDRVSRYAQGLDYHDVLLKSMKGLLRELRERIPDLVAFPSTDTGPYLEREYAWLAGLGFLGHNQCLIHEKLGSGMFLGVALTNLEIESLPEAGSPAGEPLFAVCRRRHHWPARPPVDMCGSCTRCLEACPTGALDLGRGLDANLCLSTWSIEWRGGAPREAAHLQGGLLFGCDICQAVCPWNQRAARHADSLPAPHPAYEPLASHQRWTLEDLEHISDDDFRSHFRKTPLWRCHAEGLRRNARLVRRNLEKEV